jgi:hypothetical protein
MKANFFIDGMSFYSHHLQPIKITRRFNLGAGDENERLSKKEKKGYTKALTV